MMNFEENAQWEEQVYQIRTIDPVLGGADGISNLATGQLANRTQWLKEKLISHEQSIDSHPHYGEDIGTLMGDVEGMKGNISHLSERINGLQQSNTHMWNVMGMPPGTRSLFVQSSAPTGWTKIIEHNDKALRVVTGEGGGGAGGSVAFSTAFASRGLSGSVSNTTLAEGQMPHHNHYAGVPDSTDNVIFGTVYVSTHNRRQGDSKSAYYPITSSTGGNGAHNHGLSINPLDMTVQYVDVIIASKDFYEPA